MRRSGSWVIVNEEGAFWNGSHRWVPEYPDAARYSDCPNLEAPEHARKLKSEVYAVIQDYGEITERKLFTHKSPCVDCGDRGPHEDNGNGDAPTAFSCQACGAHFDADVRA